MCHSRSQVMLYIICYEYIHNSMIPIQFSHYRHYKKVPQSCLYESNFRWQVFPMSVPIFTGTIEKITFLLHMFILISLNIFANASVLMVKSTSLCRRHLEIFFIHYILLTWIWSLWLTITKPGFLSSIAPFFFFNHLPSSTWWC